MSPNLPYFVSGLVLSQSHSSHPLPRPRSWCRCLRSLRSLRCLPSRQCPLYPFRYYGRAIVPWGCQIIDSSCCACCGCGVCCVCGVGRCSTLYSHQSHQSHHQRPLQPPAPPAASTVTSATARAASVHQRPPAPPAPCGFKLRRSVYCESIVELTILGIDKVFLESCNQDRTTNPQRTTEIHK